VTRSDDLRSHLPLHPLEFRILLVLLEGPSHGYEIVKRIEERETRWMKIYPANLYRRMRDALARGLIREVEAPVDVAEADPRRRYVALTELGRAVARDEARRLEALVADARERRLLDPEPTRSEGKA
jgi:DNA-binding PadR family transcriptional regulator